MEVEVFTAVERVVGLRTIVLWTRLCGVATSSSRTVPGYDSLMPSLPPDDLDPRVAFAAERTLLAWIRTGIALMGFASSSLASACSCVSSQLRARG